MAARQGIQGSTWRPRSKLSSELKLHVSGSTFRVDKELWAQKSAKLAKLLQDSPQEELSLLLRDIPADQESLELVARFCHGFEIKLSTENVSRVAWVAHYLEMTEDHCPNNLSLITSSYIKEQIFSSWNNSIKALKSSENVLKQALQLGLVDCCVESLILKVLDDPHLLGEPIKKLVYDNDSDEREKVNRPNFNRKLFDLEWKWEDLTTLPLRLYAPIVHAMIQREVPQEYVAANLCQYAKKWVFSNKKEGDAQTRNHSREIVEALEKLLPLQKGIVPCTFLFELLRFATALEAKTECKNGLEIRIGMQLDQAYVRDLLIPSQGYTTDEKYDTKCVRRILKNFYCNYTGPDASGLNSVAELISEFLTEISADVDLKMSTFMEFADMSAAAIRGTQRTYDGIYRALDIYLDKHRHLTESEREDLCSILDCNLLSQEAIEHASQNERLPLRVVVQVLFAGQLKLRDTIGKEVQRSDSPSRKLEGEKEEGERISCSEEEVREEIEKIGSKVLELEKECVKMRRQIEREGVKKQKRSVWKDMKRKLGCTTSVHDQDCHVKKKKVLLR